MQEKSRLEFIKYRWVCLIVGIIFLLWISGLIGLSLIGCSIAGFILAYKYPKKKEKMDDERKKRKRLMNTHFKNSPKI